MANSIPATRRSTALKLRLAGATALSALVALAGSARADYFTPTAGSATLCATGTSGSNYTHVEGSIYDGNGGVIFCELNSQHTNDLLWRYNIAARNASIVVTSSGGTQGLYFTAGGQLVTADRDTRQISLRSPSNLTAATALASTYGGKPFNGPNDLVVDAAGGTYFTDPNFENFSNNQGVDGVYYVTSGGTVSRILTFTGNDRPNGIILSPDQTTLYVDLWADNDIMAYTLTSAGAPTNGCVFIGNVACPDGMTVDPWGNVIVARTGGVSCYNPAGGKMFDVATAASGATNVDLVSVNGATSLYITAGISLYSVPLNQAPEPASLGILGAGAALLLRRRRLHAAR